MNLNIKRNIKDAVAPELTPTNELVFSVAAMGTGAGRDNKIIIEYKAGFSVEIPEGYIGMLLPISRIFIGSLSMPSSIETFTPGWHDVVARFKINTDAIPSVFEVKDEFVKLILIKNTTIDPVLDDVMAEEPEANEPVLDSVEVAA